jgi:outer membrane protein OmpA-like peptidoglycan-associated protein/Mg-chelatase subunit ChlD
MKIKSLAFLTLLCALIACSGGRHLTDFEMQRQVWDEADSLEKKNYITSTLPIDSVDAKKLIFDIWRIETDNYPQNIKVFARVYDSLGHFITNMAEPYKKDKTYKYFAKLDEGLGKIYNKKTVHIDTFNVREFGANDSIPYNIVLAVDNSGSMSGVFNTIMDGAEMFVSMKFKYDKLAVTSFSDVTEKQAPLTDNTSAILSILKGKRKSGLGRLSSVNDALWNSMDIFQDASKKDPRVMAVFTDGDENYSKKEIGQLIEKAKKENIHVFCVAFGYSKDEGLREIAKYTGGKFYKAYTKDELTAIFRDIYMSLRYYYLVDYTPPKYYGTHFVYPYLSVPGRSDSLVAQGEYDMSDMWKDVGDVFIAPILFDFNKWDIKPESFAIIDQLADQMLSRPKFKIEIQGHTDNVGTVEINQTLSEKRADAVKTALVQRGVEPARIRTRGFGLSMPIAPNETEEGRAKNRRTQFVILAK